MASALIKCFRKEMLTQSKSDQVTRCRPTDDDTEDSPEAGSAPSGQKHLSSLAVAGMTLGAVIGCFSGEQLHRVCYKLAMFQQVSQSAY